MLKLIRDSYKLYFRSFPFMFLYAIPLLLLTILNVYCNNIFTFNNGFIYFSYAAALVLPFVSAATDISIYRRLFGYKVINPLSSLRAFVLYLLAQIGIGLVGTAPIFLFNYLLVIAGVSAFWSLTLAVLINIFVGFLFMARFNIVLPLIIQNRIPSLHDFLSYTKRPLKFWLTIATTVYLPYVVINYLSASLEAVNTALTNLFMLLFICFNITYINQNRPSPITYHHDKDDDEEDTSAMTPVPAVKTAPKKAETTKPAAPKKAPVPKPAAVKKPTAKKAPKKSAPKLKPVMAKV